MTLDEAIAHAREAGEKMAARCETRSCGLEHLQLAAWLEELRRYREKYQLNGIIKDVKENR